MALIKICKVCGKDFNTKLYFVEHGGGKYCSTKCQYIGIKTGSMKACAVCGKESYKKLTQLQRSKSGKFFCGKSCQTKWRNQEFVGEKHANWKTGLHTYRNRMLQSGAPKICRLCKTADSRVLAVHHIDKNRQNNKLSNLAWLCHNCHFLVHHHEKEREKFMVPMV